MKKVILQTIAISTLSLPVHVFADNLSDSNVLFDWAEGKYSEYFYPAGPSTEELEGYILRHYLGSNTYLGTINGDVYVYGSIFGGLLKVGVVSHFLNIISSEKPSILRPLNDTGLTNDGIIGLASLLGNDPNSDCSGSEIYIFDCFYGRDAQAKAGTLQKIGGGIAGFDFTKLDASGDPLDANADNWSCVKDNNTKLIWEAKQNNSGLHGSEHVYSWYDTNPNTNGGDSGSALDQQSKCSSLGFTCSNTQAFTEQVNAEGLCGANNWRVPSKEEMRSIVNYGGSHGLNADAFGGRSSGTDQQYFPFINKNAGAVYDGGYWTSTSYLSPGADFELSPDGSPILTSEYYIMPSKEAVTVQFYYPSSTISKVFKVHKKTTFLPVMLVHDEN